MGRRITLSRITTLVVPVPPPGIARLRFVTTAESMLSKLIRFDTSGAVSHVEAVMTDGTIIASHLDTGVARFPIDYDTSSTLQIIVDLKMPLLEFSSWSNFLISCIGRPYDKAAILDFISHFNAHEKNALICSALQVDALRHCGWFPVPLAQRYHQISPVVLLLMLQADPRSVIHAAETGVQA
jgi:hypothetical protein